MAIIFTTPVKSAELPKPKAPVVPNSVKKESADVSTMPDFKAGKVWSIDEILNPPKQKPENYRKQLIELLLVQLEEENDSEREL